MNILLLTQVLPYPPDSGPKIKTLNVIKFLSQRHHITLVSFVRGDQREEIETLKRWCKDIYTVPIQRSRLKDFFYLLLSFLSGQSFFIRRDDRVAMRRLVDRLAAARPYDVVQADQLMMAQYASRVKAFRVLDEHNAVWLLYKRMAATTRPGLFRLLLEREWRVLKRYEGRVCREFDAILAVSEEDQTALQTAAGIPLNITTIPISMDTSQIPVVKRDTDANHLVYIGTMNWPPNVDGVMWFIREILPIIKKQRPDVILDVVGANPPAELIAMNGNSVNVTGYVTEPLPFLRSAGVIIVPLLAGGGMRVKILNALAASLPVVSTTIGAEGIKVQSGRHLLIADTPTIFAQAILQLLEHPALASRLGENGRRLIESTYDYQYACQPLEQVYPGPSFDSKTSVDLKTRYQSGDL